MNVWTVFDAVFLGPNAPLVIDSAFPLDVTRQRLETLSQPDSPDDPTMPELSVAVNEDEIYATYAVRGSSRQSSVIDSWRPVFRGRLVNDGSVRLVGEFGLDATVRVLGFVAIVVAIVMSLGSAFPAIGSVGLSFWMFPLLFVVGSACSRANFPDDARLITHNLTYALRGDDDAD